MPFDLTNTDLPNYVFIDQYDHFCLFMERELQGRSFSQKIQSLCIANNTEYYSLKLIVPLGNIDKFPQTEFHIPSNQFESLWDFYNNSFIDQAGVFLFNFNFFLYDSKENWRAYVSCSNEICIFGYMAEISIIFNNIFKPYEELKFDDKLMEIEDRFVFNTKDKSIYINALLKNYHFL